MMVLYVCHDCEAYNTRQIVWCPRCGRRVKSMVFHESPDRLLQTYEHFSGGRKRTLSPKPQRKVVTIKEKRDWREDWV